MARGVGGHEYRLDPVVLHQFLERRIGLRAPAGLRQARALLGHQVADGHDLHVRMILETKGGPETADPIPDNADPETAVGDRLPALRRVWIHRGLLETGDGNLVGGPSG